MTSARLKAAILAAGLTATDGARLTGLSRTFFAAMVRRRHPIEPWVVAVIEMAAAVPRPALEKILSGLPGEHWRQCRRFPDYEVSSLGQVRRAVPASRIGHLPNAMLRLDQDGYLTASIYDANGVQRRARVHRLVAEAFIQRRDPTKVVVCHRDNDRANARADNLYWGDAADNAADRVRAERQRRRAALRARTRARDAQRKLERAQKKAEKAAKSIGTDAFNEAQARAFVMRGSGVQILPAAPKPTR